MKKSLFVLGIFIAFIFYTPASSQEISSFSQFKSASDLAAYKILALSAIEFKPIDSNQFQTFEWEWNDIGITVPSGNPETLTLAAQIHLPDGAVIKRVAAVYYDNSTPADMDISMAYVTPFDTSEPDMMVFLTSDGLPNADALRVLDTKTILDPTIDNTNIYVAIVEFDSSTMGDVAFRALYIAYE